MRLPLADLGSVSSGAVPGLGLQLMLLAPGQGLIDEWRVVVGATGAVQGEAAPADTEAGLHPMPRACDHAPEGCRLGTTRAKEKVHHTAS